jgi:ubiquitin-protein ligase
MLNGTMSIPGLLDRWTPEWRMRAVVEALERVLAAPDECLMTAFQLESQRLRGPPPSVKDPPSPTSHARPALRHPRDMAAACVELFRRDREQFSAIARRMTQQCAADEV